MHFFWSFCVARGLHAFFRLLRNPFTGFLVSARAICYLVQLWFLLGRGVPHTSWTDRRQTLVLVLYGRHVLIDMYVLVVTEIRLGSRVEE